MGLNSSPEKYQMMVTVSSMVTLFLLSYGKDGIPFDFYIYFKKFLISTKDTSKLFKVIPLMLWSSFYVLQIIL